MSDLKKNILWWTIILLLLGGVIWLWFALMEKTWIAFPHQSDAARKNPMLAATRLLEQHQYRVQLTETLSESVIRETPDGTMIIAESDGFMSQRQATMLLSWVERGNTLIMSPRVWRGVTNDAVEDSDEDNAENPASSAVATQPEKASSQGDPIGERLGLVVVADNEVRKGSPSHVEETDEDVEGEDTKTIKTALIEMPNTAYMLQLKMLGWKLQASPLAQPKLATPVLTSVLADEKQQAVHVAVLGKGRIVALADNYFSYHRLGYYDHAEFLLALLKLHPSSKNINIVQRLKISSWTTLLWDAFKYGLVAVFAALLLMMWRAVRRFGPLLPEAHMQRRSLLEHIDASARWLWQKQIGRDVLLEAARAHTRVVLQRRVPELNKIPMPERIKKMAQDCHLHADTLSQAWLDAASEQPHIFSKQIQYLQLLRKHYER